MALKLPRFLRDLSIVDVTKGTPTIAFHQWWESVLQQIESSVNGIQAALDAAGIAQAAADNANAAAAAASNTAKLSNSGVTGLTFTATDAGSDVTISISSHTRSYADGTSVAVNGGSFTGLLYSTTYYVYYNDSTFSGGSVSYQITTSQMDAVQGGVRHLVGAITTPAAAAGPTDGGFPPPPGFDFVIP